jgi:hypothetical protein
LPSPGAAAASAGRLSVPAGTPYDRQVLLQCIRSTVARWGAAAVALGGHRLVAAGGTPHVLCARCGRPAGAVQCRIDIRVLCLRCALADAAVTPGDQATVARGPLDSAQRKPQRAQRRNAPAGRTSSSAI